MKKICVVTVSRADYGLLRWVAKAIDDSNELELQILATGSHFADGQGNTIDEIRDDGIVVNAEIPMASQHTDVLGVTQALGRGLGDLGGAIDNLRPDCIVLLGDRAETLVAALASTLATVPIAHIHGGEITIGAIDDAFRHAITKMSHLHFVAHEDYRRRVLQLGEKDSSVYKVGPLGIESILRRQLMSRKDLEEQLGITFGPRNLLVTIHPETLYPHRTDQLVESLLSGLGLVGEANLFFTAANMDVGGDVINQKIRDYCAHNERAWFFESLGSEKYLSLMKHMDAVVGNSSSGLFEAPTLGVPTVDIGHRQEGRIAGATVRNVPADSGAIRSAILDCFELPPRKVVKGLPDIDETTLPSGVITTVLETVDFRALLAKKFVDQYSVASGH